MEYAIDATRAGDTLSSYLRRHQVPLQDQVSGVVLDFKLNKAVDDLCRRIAGDIGHPIAAEERSLRALLSARITAALANFLNEPDAEIYRSTARPTDEQVLAAVFRRVLPKVRLPREWDGQRFER